MSGRSGWLWLFVLTLSLGCGVGPRRFQDLNDPAPSVRARAAGLANQVPEEVAIPALIERLDDKDGVVRLSAIETLRKRTGQDLDYVPWAGPEERAEAVGRWRLWWGQRQADLVKSRQIP